MTWRTRTLVGAGASAVVAVALAGCSAPPAVESPDHRGVTTIATPTSEASVTAAAPTVPTITVSPRSDLPTKHVFPVVPASGVSYGHVHHDYPATDIFSPCGTDGVAVADGVVQEVSRTDSWKAATDDPAVRGGLSVSIVGDDGVRYYYSHFHDILPNIEPGLRVAAGDVIAHVGETGNAVGLGCHVHFGLSPDCGPGDWEVRRGILYPWPYLDAWRDGEESSPAAAVAAWLTAHPDQCAHPGAAP